MKYLILGAGPTGLAFANRLLQHDINDFLVIEKEKIAGGLCRSEIVDGSPLDIGGGHFLDVRLPEVNEFLFRFMPETEWQIYDRDSQIWVNNLYIHHPFEANIWEMDVDTQISYLKSIAQAGCNIGQKEPEDFVSWITWKLGKKIADDYMLPYNQKMFGTNLNALGNYWLDKLPDVSFEDTLRSCLERKPYAKQPGHAQFYYPKKYGYGELWKRMAKALGDRIQYGKSICGIDFELHEVTTEDDEIYKADKIITTIPWPEISSITGCPDEIIRLVEDLKYTSIRVNYYTQNIETKAHWIYNPDLNVDFHRILVRHNFCIGSRGYWTETNETRVSESGNALYSYLNKYAYPLNTKDKPRIMKRLLEWSGNNEVYGLGRWGEHQHYNSDVTVGKAISLADEMAL